MPKSEKVRGNWLQKNSCPWQEKETKEQMSLQTVLPLGNKRRMEMVSLHGHCKGMWNYLHYIPYSISN